MNLLAGLGSVGRGVSQGAEDWRRQDEADAAKKRAQREEVTFNNQQDALKREGSLRDALSQPDADVPAVLKAAGKHSEALQYEASQRSAESGKMDFSEKQYGAKVREKIRGIYGDYTAATSTIDENDPEAMSKRAAGFKNTIEGAGEILTKLGGPYKGFTYGGINAQGTAVIFKDPNGNHGEVPITPDLVKQAMQLRIDAADPDAAHARVVAMADKKALKGVDTEAKIAEAEGTGAKAKNVAQAGLANAEAGNVRAGKGKYGTGGGSATKVHSVKETSQGIVAIMSDGSQKVLSGQDGKPLFGQAGLTAATKLVGMPLYEEGVTGNKVLSLAGQLNGGQAAPQSSAPANRPPLDSFLKK